MWFRRPSFYDVLDPSDSLDLTNKKKRNERNEKNRKEHVQKDTSIEGRAQPVLAARIFFAQKGQPVSFRQRQPVALGDDRRVVAFVLQPLFDVARKVDQHERALPLRSTNNNEKSNRKKRNRKSLNLTKPTLTLCNTIQLNPS